MTTVSTFALKRARRGDRAYLEILVDGRPLLELIVGRPDTYPNHISPIGWGPDDVQRLTIGRLLLEATGEFPNGRHAVLVCAECGDLGCGAYSAVIRREGDIVTWSDFGFENSLGVDPVDRTCGQRRSHVAFSWPEYEQVLRSRQGVQQSDAAAAKED